MSCCDCDNVAINIPVVRQPMTRIIEVMLVMTVFFVLRFCLS